MYKVISYYTKNTPYETESKELIHSLEKFGIAHDIRGVDNLGSWHKNTMRKAGFIMDMMKQADSEAIVWMDVDAVVKKEPVFLDMIDSDVALYYRTEGGRIPRLKEDMELLSGTMYFKVNDHAKLLVEMWVEENRRFPNEIEQYNLQKVVPQWRKQGGVLSLLSQSYLQIFDADKDETVIVHNQASRRFRKSIDE